MYKIIQALEMARTELISYYRKIQVDRSNVLTAVEDAIIEAKTIKNEIELKKMEDNPVEYFIKHFYKEQEEILKETYGEVIIKDDFAKEWRETVRYSIKDIGKDDFSRALHVEMIMWNPGLYPEGEIEKISEEDKELWKQHFGNIAERFSKRRINMSEYKETPINKCPVCNIVLAKSGGVINCPHKNCPNAISLPSMSEIFNRDKERFEKDELPPID